jgi:hypothetical protein
MRDVRFSKPNPVKLTNFHIVISSLAAIAGEGYCLDVDALVSDLRRAPPPVDVPDPAPCDDEGQRTASAAQTVVETL